MLLLTENTDKLLNLVLPYLPKQLCLLPIGISHQCLPHQQTSHFSFQFLKCLTPHSSTISLIIFFLEILVVPVFFCQGHTTVIMCLFLLPGPYNSHKLQFRSQELFFLDYFTSHKAYECFSPDGRLRISICHEVKAYVALLQNKTWTLVPLPLDRAPICCNWVFHTKEDYNGSINQYKACLVAKFTTKSLVMITLRTFLEKSPYVENNQGQLGNNIPVHLEEKGWEPIRPW